MWYNGQACFPFVSYIYIYNLTCSPEAQINNEPIFTANERDIQIEKFYVVHAVGRNQTRLLGALSLSPDTATAFG